MKETNFRVKNPTVGMAKSLKISNERNKHQETPQFHITLYIREHTGKRNHKKTTQDVQI